MMKDISKIKTLIAALIMTTASVLALFPISGLERPTMDPYHPAEINANVTLPNGSAASGFLVIFQPDHSYFYEWEMTDHQGKASIEVPWESLGNGELRVKNESSTIVYNQPLALFPDQVQYLDIEVEDPPPYDRTVRGTVLNSTSGEPVPGAVVVLSGPDYMGNQLSFVNNTGASGEYEFQFPYSNISSYYLRATATGFLSTSVHFFTKEDQTNYQRDLPIMPEYEQNGEHRIRYVNSSTGVPFTGGIMGVECHPASRDHYTFYSSNIPDENGWFAIDNRKGETRTSLNLGLPEFPLTSVSVFNSYVLNGTEENVQHELDIPDNVTISITVTNSSGTLDSASVGYYSYLYRNDADWRFNYNSNVEPDGTLDIVVPANETLDFNFFASGHAHRYMEIGTHPSDPREIEVVMEKYQAIPYEDLPKGDVRFEVVDNQTSIPVKHAEIRGRIMVDMITYTVSETANETGVFQGEIPAGYYSYITASYNFGSVRLNDVMINEGSNDPIVFRIERVEPETEPDISEYYLTFNDISGNPVSDAVVRVRVTLDESTMSNSYYTDDQGRIFFHADKGSTVSLDTRYQSVDRTYNPWVLESQFLDLPKGSGSAGNVTLFSRGETEEIYGFVRDSVSGNSISSVELFTRSYRPMDGTRLFMIPPSKDEMDLFFYTTFSTFQGLYRTWGTDHVEIEAHREGYYPKTETIDLTTRSSTEHDILMDPLPDEKYRVNGTVVDENGEGVHSMIYIWDRVHTLMDPVVVETDEDGHFSARIFPGNYSFSVSNDTLNVQHDVDVASDISDLELVLFSTTMLGGYVTGPSGGSLPDMDVILEKDVNGTYQRWDNTTTNATGYYYFIVRAGSYRVRVNGTDSYSEYIGSPVTTDGWSPEEYHIELENRTMADIIGTVKGESGPYREGVEGVIVTLMRNGTEQENTTTDSNGTFMFADIPHGIHSIYASPPEVLLPVEGIRSGYLANSTGNFTVEGALVEIDLDLPYEVITSPAYVNVTYNSPNGTDVYLDETIMIQFDRTMDTLSFEQGFSAQPELTGLNFTWDPYQTVVLIDHDDFMPDTMYTLTIGAMVVSFEGYPLFKEFSWNFTTGNTTDPWEIYTANVDMDENKNVSVSVTAPVNLTIFFVLENVGYLEMVEGPNGTYTLDIEGDELTWDFEHHYFFTNRNGGYDLAPDLSGSLTTPEEPSVPVTWRIDSVDVEVRNTGTWDVNVEAPSGLDIFMVIEDVGSFRVEEDAPGYYRVLIGYENFEWDREYSYHFSSTEDGEDEAPSVSGTAFMPKEPEAPPGDDDPPFVLCCVGILILLAIIIAVIVIIARKKGDRGPFEE